MTNKHLALALIPIIGASVLLWGADGNLSGRGDLIYATNLLRSTNTYPVQWNTNLPPLQSLMIGNSQVFTNIVISNDYSGTIQIGTNFVTIKELEPWVQVVSEMKKAEEQLAAIKSFNANRLAATNVNRTYTVDVADGLWTHTNVIDIHRCSEFCTRMRYVENGLTNDFHAAFTSFTVITNAP